MDGKPFELYNLNRFGIIADMAPHLLPPEAWSGGANVRFTDDGVEPVYGYVQVFGALSVVPESVFNVPAIGASYWIYVSLTKAYVYDSGVHSNITRQTASVDVDYTASAGKAWQATIFGGIPILNNYSDVPQYWTAVNPSNKLANLTNWPSTLRAKIVVGFGPYLVALNLLDSTTLLPSAVQWSHKADPGTLPASWDYSDPTVDAGRLQLTDAKGGEITDALLLGNQLVVYKEFSTHLIRFVGGQDILSPDLIFANSGILAAKCACLYKKGTRHFVVTANDIITHAATKDSIEFIADSKVRDEIFSDLDPDNYTTAFCFENEALSEVVFAYPTAGNVYPNKAAVWNYKADRNNWSFRDWVGESADIGDVPDTTEVIWNNATPTWDTNAETWSSQARLQIAVSSRANSKIYQHNTGYTFDGMAAVAYVERIGIAIDSKDRMGNPKASISSVKQLSRLWPRVEGDVTFKVKVGAHDKPDAPVVYEPEVEFDPEVDEYVDSIAVGKLIAVRYEVAVGSPWRLTAHHLEIARLSDL